MRVKTIKGSKDWKSSKDRRIRKDKRKSLFLYHLVRVDTGQKLKRCYCFLDDQVENDMRIVAVMQ